MQERLASGTHRVFPRKCKVLVAFLITHSYAVMSVGLVALVAWSTLRIDWHGDFWVISAGVKEVTQHPFSPGNPHLPGDHPHAIYNFYVMATGWFAYFFGLDAISALSISGVSNVVLLLVGFWFFASELADKKAAPLALLFCLFLWGVSPWRFTGFYHFGILYRVHPYYSTFATGLALITLGSLLRTQRTKQNRWLLVVLAGVPIVMLSHPPTAFAMLLVVAALRIALRGLSPGWDAVVLGLSVVIGLLLWRFWPFAPLWEALTSPNEEFVERQQVLYESVLRRIWPALLGVPWVAYRIVKDRRYPAAWVLGALTCAYVYGWLAENWSLGRVMPWIVLLLHISLAEFVITFTDINQKERRTLKWHLSTVAVALTVLLLLCADLVDIRTHIERYVYGETQTSADLAFLAQYTEQSDVILSDIKTSWMTPTFGGKVVATPQPQFWVPDIHSRRDALDRFFQAGCSFEQRESIIKKYGATHVLIAASAHSVQWELEQDTRRLGNIVKRSGDYTLVKVSK